MALPPLYPAHPGSPYTTLAAPYTSGDTTVTLVDASTRPVPPNLLCLEGSPGSAVLRYTGNDGNTLTGVEQIEGPIDTWPAGSYAFRGFSAYDHDTMIEHLDALESADPLPPGTAGDYLYHDGTAWTAQPLEALPAGTQGDLLAHDGTSWVGLPATAHDHPISSIANLQAALDEKEPAFTKKTAFNKDFGTAAGTVCQGDDSRLSNARIPTAHTHTIANITDINTPIRTLVLLGSSFIFPATNGASLLESALSNGVVVRGASFGASSSNILAQIGHSMPANWDGSTVTAQFLFTTSATAGTVIFAIHGRASISDAALGQAFGTAQSATFDIGAQAGRAAWDLWVSGKTGNITLAGTPTNTGRRYAHWQVYRAGTDTCSAAVTLLAVAIEYKTKSYGDA